MIPVSRLMTKNVLKVNNDAIIKDVAVVMKDEKVGSLLVAKDEKVVGIITETDIIQKVVADDLNPYVTKAESIMSAPLLCIDVNKTIIDANDMMDQRHVRHLGVTDGEDIVGILSVRDILHPLYFKEDEGW
ncbi:MAG: cyclic nucleotide-binding/CBS domain-containing protein [Nitrospirota bacterium]